MKKNIKGFTLIELLAVITIMGILMLVAIPAISRTIENARKDTFIDTVRKYAESARNMWMADNFSCTVDGIEFPSSAVQNGTYYIRVDTSDPNLPQVLEKGGKSPWGGRDIKGIITFVVYIKNGTRMVKVFPSLVDGIHGINVNADGSFGGTVYDIEKFKRGDIVMTNSKYTNYIKADGSWKGFWFSVDLNQDGDRGDIIDGVPETEGTTRLCVER